MLSESKKQYHFKWKPEAADKLRVLKADYLGGGLWSSDVSFRMIWEMDNHKCQQYRHDLPHLLECSVSGDSIGCLLPRYDGLNLIPASWEELIVAACNVHTAHSAGEAEPGGSPGLAGQSAWLAFWAPESVRDFVSENKVDLYEGRLVISTSSLYKHVAS